MIVIGINYTYLLEKGKDYGTAPSIYNQDYLIIETPVWYPTSFFLDNPNTLFIYGNSDYWELIAP